MGRKLPFATDGGTLVPIALKAPELEARGQPAYSNSCWGEAGAIGGARAMGGAREGRPTPSR